MFKTPYFTIAVSFLCLSSFLFSQSHHLVVQTIQSAKRPQVVAFLSTQCPCSQSYESELLDLSQHFSQFDYWVIYSRKTENQILSQHSSFMAWTQVRDQEYHLADYYKAYKTPHVFVIQNGRTLYSGGVGSHKKYESSREPVLFLRRVMEAIVSGKSIPYKKKRVMGCLIRQ